MPGVFFYSYLITIIGGRLQIEPGRRFPTLAGAWSQGFLG